MTFIDFGSEAGLLAAWLVAGLLFRAALRFKRRRKPASPREPFAGKVFVIDGDTIHVRRVRVRLFGMDAPELTQRGGWKARSHLIACAGGRGVVVEPIDIDCYGRVVARVWLGPVDLSEKMVRDGYARGISTWCTDYAAAEFDARRNRRGLWAGNGISDPAAHRRWKGGTALTGGATRPPQA